MEQINERSLINNIDTDYTGNTKTTNTINSKKIWTLETLKQSSSNFDKLTKAIEANLNPEDKEKTNLNTKMTDFGNQN